MASGHQRPTLRAVRLGQELRKLRDEAGKSSRRLATDLGTQATLLSRKETGLMPATKADVDDYLRACNVHDPKRRDNLYKICRDVLQKGWWDGYTEDIAGELMDRIWLESKTTHIDTYEAIAIPGLLQVPAYAETLMRVDRPEAPDEDIERWLEVRITRQHVLTRHNPIQYRAIIDEATIQRRATGPDVMKLQLEYLAKASDFDNVEIRILPFNAGIHPSLTGSFEVVTLQDPYPPAGLLQIPGGDVCVEGDTIDLLTHTYDRLLELSLSPEASKELILSERDKP